MSRRLFRNGGGRPSLPAPKTATAPGSPRLPGGVLAAQLRPSLGNQAVSQIIDRGLEMPSPADPREREASNRARTSEHPVTPDAEGVRLHTDERAAQMADAVDSRAFTIGKDIFFGRGQFDPKSATGRDVIDHELTHAYLHDDPAKPALLRLPLPGADDRQATSNLNLTLTPEIPAPGVIQSEGATLATVYFGQGDFLLADSRALQVLERLARDLTFFVDPTVTVDGFASGEGTDADNVALSEKRRQAVIALLSGQLPQAPTIGGTAHGEADPAEPESGSGAELERKRARNRRVEIFVAPRTPLTAPAPAPTPPGLRPRLDIGPETDSERLNRILRTPPPTRPPQISLADAAKQRLNEAVDNVLRRTNLSRPWRERIRNAAVDAITSAAGKALDAAIDEAPLGSEERDALKAAIRAAIQTPSLPQ